MVLDLRKLSDLTDYFVIATGQTRRQAQAAAEKLRSEMAALTGRAPNTEGLGDGLWVLIDLYDVVVHLFQPEPRAYYELEMLWGDAPRVNWRPVRRRKTPQGS